MRPGHRLVPLFVLTAAAVVASAAALGALSGSAIEVPGTGTLNVKGAVVSTVTCAKAGFCAAGGEYTESSGGLDGSGAEQAFVVDETNGVWGTAIEVPGRRHSTSPATRGCLTSPVRQPASAPPPASTATGSWTVTGSS